MAMLNKLILRLRALFFKSKMEDELQAELRFHIEREIEENIVRGMTPEEARYAALRNFGGVERVKEESRDVRGIRLLEELRQDLRYAVRILLRSPGFSFIAIATMALGIGATTAIYSVIDATLLHPLPYPNPSELVRIEDDLPGIGAQDLDVSIPEWRDLENSGIFQYVALDYFNSVNLTGSAQPTR